MKKHFFALASGIFFVGMVGTATAQIFYTDTNLFATAAAGNSVYTMPLQPPNGDSTTQDVGATITIGQVTYEQAALFLYNDGYYGLGTYYLGGSGSDLTVSIAGGGYKYIDFELGVFNKSDSVQITVNGLSSDTLTIPGAPDSTFIGITDTTPITSLTFHDNDNPGAEIDILSPSSGIISLPPPTPEPSILALGGLGGLVLLYFRRRGKDAVI
jgi:hypothetical protein